MPETDCFCCCSFVPWWKHLDLEPDLLDALVGKYIPKDGGKAKAPAVAAGRSFVCVLVWLFFLKGGGCIASHTSLL